MKCMQARALFSSYLDGAVTGGEMREVSRHIHTCADCEREYGALEETQGLLSTLGPKPAPAGLAVQLQVALSQAAAQSYSRRFEGVRVRWSNALNAFMFPATAGLATAMLFFALVVGFFAVPVNVEASSAGDDVPLLLYTPPQLNSSPFITTIGSMDGSLVVETYVDANGRVQDYRIISAPDGTEKLIPQLDNMMIFTTFRPAMNLGRPTSSRVVLSFSGVNVKG